MTALPLRALPFRIDENLRGHPFYIRSATWTKTRDGPVLKLGSEVSCRIFFANSIKIVGSREKNRDGRSTINRNIFFFWPLGKTPDASQKGKNARQRPYLGEIFRECCFTSFYIHLCDPHYTLSYYQLYRYLVSLY